MRKWIKRIVGILLLPLCLGGATALWRVVARTGEADTLWVILLSGAACWWVVYLLLPKPMWLYILGHELTHALWTWLFWGKVKKFKVSHKGGHVIITRSNFLVSLAPYFFPFYAALVILMFVLGDWIWGWTPYRIWFHLLLGAAYAFHVSLTWHVLHMRQSDITEQGYLFSSVVIVLGNMSVLLLGLPLLAGRPDLQTTFLWWWHETQQVFIWLGSLIGLTLSFS